VIDIDYEWEDVQPTGRWKVTWSKVTVEDLRVSVQIRKMQWSVVSG